MLTPFGTDVRMQARPWANWAVIAATVLAYLAVPERPQVWLMPPKPAFLALHGFGTGIVTHVFVHANAVHLWFNMIFLWVFGNTIAPRLGVRGYLCFYFAAAAFVGFVHALTSDRTFVGASSAINAVVAMFLVVHPLDRVRTIMLAAPVAVPGYAAVMVWVALDMWGLTETTNVDHAGHLLGFLFGFVTAVILIRTRRMPLATFEVTLFDLRVGRWLAGPSSGRRTKGKRTAERGNSRASR